MAKNFYNLPPPWNPGYAIPKSVMDEGLERRAFVTAQLPRGTYDSVSTSAMGYAVPSYVMAEKTGRGTYTTKWLPRGYYGPAVPHWLDDVFTKILGPKRQLPGDATAMTVATLGDTGSGARGSLSSPWNTYGARSAKRILAKVRRYPAASQGQVLKVILNAIDPSLYERMMRAADQAVADGIPKERALEYALATSMTTGILKELAKVGSSRTAPQPRSLLGLGVYGARSALGGINIAGGGGGFSTGGGTWTVQGSGGQATGTGIVTVTPTPWTVEANGGATTGGVITPTVQPTMIQIGPFVMEDKVGAKLRLTPQNSTPDIMKQVIAALARGTVAVPTMTYGPGGMTYGPLDMSEIDKNALEKMFGGGSGMIAKSMVDGRYPVFKFKHPKTGRLMALKIQNLGTKDAPGYDIYYVDIDPNWLGKLVDGLVELIAKIIDVVKDIAQAVADAACQALQAPGAAGAAAAATGGAAGAGVIIAGSMCGGATPTPPVPMPESPSLLVPLAIGGAALLAIAIIKKRKATP